MSRRKWPLPLSVREGVATARSGRWVSLLVGIAIAWVVAAPGAADAVAVSRLVDNEQAWIDAGGHVYVVSGAGHDNSQNPIPASVCDHLSSIEGIEASFAASRSDATGTLSYIPGGRVSLYEVSAGVLEFLGVPPAERGIVLATHSFVDRTGATDGDVVRLELQETSGTEPLLSDPLTLRVVDTDNLGDEFDGALLVPTRSTANADTCYVRTNAAHDSAVQAALPALLAYNGDPAIPGPRLFESDFTVDYAHAYQDRPLRWVWVPAAALLGLLWAMLQWFRRSHVAIYATFGMRAASRLVMQLGEWGVLAAMGALWGWCLGVVSALALGAHPEQAIELVTFHGMLTVIGATVLVALLGLRPAGTLLNALKDR